MDGTNRRKETPLSVNVLTAPGKAIVGERPKAFGESFGFDPITPTLIFGEHDAVLVDAIMEFRGDKVAREAQYFADPFVAPASRAQWIERMYT